jgi:hypothetical protein
MPRKQTYKVEDTGWRGLVGGLLAEEQESLSGVCGPGGVLVGNILELLTAKVASESLVLNWLSAEKEKLLLENEAPIG